MASKSIFSNVSPDGFFGGGGVEGLVRVEMVRGAFQVV
jgi:hypothetical protein